MIKRNLVAAALIVFFASAHAEEAVHPDVAPRSAAPDSSQSAKVQPDLAEVAAIVAEQRNKAQNELAMCHGQEGAYMRKITALENAIKAKDQEINSLKAASIQPPH